MSFKIIDVLLLSTSLSFLWLFQHQFFIYSCAVASLSQQYNRPLNPRPFVYNGLLAFRSLKSLSHLSRRVIIVETDVMSRCVCRSRTAGYRSNQIFHYKRHRRWLLLLLLLLWRFILDPNVDHARVHESIKTVSNQLKDYDFTIDIFIRYLLIEI